MLKKIITTVLALSLLLGSSISVMAEDADLSKNKKQYELSVDEENCTVSVIDSTGEALISTNPVNPEEDEFTVATALNNIRSQLVVTYYDSKNVDAVIGSYLSCVKRNSFKITKDENKIRIDYDFSRKNEQFIIPVEYSLEDGQFKVTVLTDEIEEYGDKKIYKISVVPYLLRGTSEDSGYLLLPDGSGAKMDFSYINPYASTYSNQIYGKDLGEALYYDEGNAKQIAMPVFGADYGDYGVLAKVDGNAPAGIIEANCVGVDSSYAHIYATYVYRIFDTVTIAGNDWRFKEYVAESEVVEEEAFSISYYITEDGGLNSLAQKCREITEDMMKSPNKVLTGAIYAYGSTTQKAAFLGVPYTKTLEVTTFGDMSKLLESLKMDNQSLAVFMADFDNASMNEKYPNGIKWSKYSGGNEAYEQLYSKYGEEHAFYCVQNILYENNSSLLWLNQHKYAQMAGKETLARYTYSPVTYAHTKTDWYGLNLSTFQDLGNKALSKASESNCGLALQYIGSELYGDYSKEKGTNRVEYMKEIAELLNKHSATLPLAIDGANDYTFGTADIHYNVPVSSSNYNMETESVPFLQMVYHGNTNMVSSAINMTDNPQLEMLNCVSSGTIPCFAVTGMENAELRRSGYKTLFNTGFSSQKETISDFFARTTDYYNEIYDQCIVSYEVENGISITKYENGITAVVNYTENAVNYLGSEIEAMDFVILK